MRDIDKGDANFLVQCVQFDLQHPAQLGIEGAQGLVQQQDLGPQNQRSGQGNTLLLPARQLVWPPSLESGQPYQFQCFANATLGLGLRAINKAQTKSDVVGNRLVGEQGVTLKHRIDRPTFGCHRTHVDAVDANGAVLDVFESADQPQCGGLSASRWAEQREELASLDRQIDRIQHLLFAVPLGELGDLDSTATATATASAHYRLVTRQPGRE